MRNRYARFVKEQSTCWFNDVQETTFSYVPCQLANQESPNEVPDRSPSAVFTDNVSVRYNGWDPMEGCIAINPGELVFRSDAEYVGKLT